MNRMIGSLKNRGLALLGVLLVLVISGGVVAGITGAFSGSHASGDCIDPVKVQIADGPVPGGGRWTVSASLQSDESCEGKLLGIQFRPDGTAAGSWEERRDLSTVDGPTGRPDLLEISSQDEVATTGRVVSGFVTPDVKWIRVSLDDGRHFMVRPKAVKSSLARRFPWLRQFKYFVRFYPSGAHAREIILTGSGTGEPVRVFSGGAGEFSG